MKNIVVTGGHGQLGLALNSLKEAALHVGLHLILLGKAQLDVADTSAVCDYLDSHDVHAVVNAAAHTDVDGAEAEFNLAWRLNAEVPGQLAEICLARSIPLLHVSTDYVFDGGKQGDWTEGDATEPLNAYGKTKLAGEQALLAALPDGIILRSSWLFSQFGNNFLKTILRLAQNGGTLRVVSDQFGGPTYAPHLAMAVLKILSQRLNKGDIAGGIYHFSGQPYTNWYGFSQEILHQATCNGMLTQKPQLRAILSAAYPTAARRPKNTRLCSAKLAAAIGATENDWRFGVRQTLHALNKPMNPHD